MPPPPLGPISFAFVQFLAKILPNNMFLLQIQELVPPPVWELLDPPLEIIATYYT